MRLFLRKKGCSVTESMRERLCVDLDGLIQRDIHWGTSCRTIVTLSDGDHVPVGDPEGDPDGHAADIKFDDFVCRDLLYAGRPGRDYGLLACTLV